MRRHKLDVFEVIEETLDDLLVSGWGENPFFREFVKERNIELDRITREKQREDMELRRFTPPEGYTSRSWYMELKRRAAGGDPEAIRQLSPP